MVSVAVLVAPNQVQLLSREKSTRLPCHSSHVPSLEDPTACFTNSSDNSKTDNWHAPRTELRLVQTIQVYKARFLEKMVLSSITPQHGVALNQNEIHPIELMRR